MKGLRYLSAALKKCINGQKPVSKKLSVKLKGTVIWISLFIFAFPAHGFGQLTYDNLIVQYDSPWIYKDLKLIPVRFKEFDEGQTDFLKEGIIGFEQALKEGKLSVKETNLPGGADVGLLQVKNHSKKNVIVHSGEIVAGGKQDRAFATTTIIPPAEAENYLPVFCIEKGRWTRKGRAFEYGGTADAALRKQIEIYQKQSNVWKEIDRQLLGKELQNKTWAYLDLFRDTSDIDTAYMRFFSRKMMDTDSAYSGFIAITGNRIINSELFGNSYLCTASYDAMIKSYVRSISPHDGFPMTSNDYVKIFLNKFLQTKEQQKKYLAEHGRMYLYQNNVIHLVAYDE